jgi:hypothetical protein
LKYKCKQRKGKIIIAGVKYYSGPVNVYEYDIARELSLSSASQQALRQQQKSVKIRLDNPVAPRIKMHENSVSTGDNLG